MIYIKSTLVGIVTLVVATIIYVIWTTSIMLRNLPPHPGTEVGINLIALLNRPIYWSIAVVAFALGFYLGHRRRSG